jgi:hypothetical protein
MKALELINDLRNALSDVKKDGHTTIPVAGLESYLANVESIIKNQTQADQEVIKRDEAWKKYQSELKVWEIQTNVKSAFDTEMFKSVIEAGQTALKSAIIINGGAAAAMLAFLGGLIGKETDKATCLYQISGLSYSLLIFVFGLGFAGLSSGVRYLAQFCYGMKWQKWGNCFNVPSILLGALSFAAFFYGGVEAYLALR